jgi:hypothetical protein
MVVHLVARSRLSTFEAQIIALADLRADVPKDVMRGRDVEKGIGQGEGAAGPSSNDERCMSCTRLWGLMPD